MGMGEYFFNIIESTFQANSRHYAQRRKKEKVLLFKVPKKNASFTFLFNSLLKAMRSSFCGLAIKEVAAWSLT